MAIKEFDKAIYIKSNIDYFFIKRAYAKFNLKKFKESIDDCNEAIKISPQNKFAYSKRGSNFLCLSFYDNAINDQNIALYIDKNFAQAYFIRGLAILCKDKFLLGIDNITHYYKAKKDLEKSNEIDPNYIPVVKELLNDYKFNNFIKFGKHITTILKG